MACNPGFNVAFWPPNHKGDLPGKGALQHKGYYGGVANVSGDAKPKSPQFPSTSTFPQPSFVGGRALACPGLNDRRLPSRHLGLRTPP